MRSLEKDDVIMSYLWDIGHAGDDRENDLEFTAGGRVNTDTIAGSQAVLLLELAPRGLHDAAGHSEALRYGSVINLQGGGTGWLAMVRT